MIQTRRKRKTALQTGTDAERKEAKNITHKIKQSAQRLQLLQSSHLQKSQPQRNLQAKSRKNRIEETVDLAGRDRKEASARSVTDSAESNVESVGSVGSDLNAMTGTEGTTGTAITETEGRKSRKGEMKPKRIIFILAMLAALATGCTRPVHDSSYVNLNRLKGWSDGTPIKLSFEMPDSLGESELYIIGEISTKRTIEEKTGYPIKLLFVAPCGTMYTDSVKLPLHVIQDGHIARTSNGIKEIEWPYRKNIYNKIPGKWEVTVTPADTAADYSDILGLGIRCKLIRL